jgi:lactam utilization protein B
VTGEKSVQWLAIVIDRLAKKRIKRVSGFAIRLEFQSILLHTDNCAFSCLVILTEQQAARMN